MGRLAPTAPSLTEVSTASAASVHRCMDPKRNHRGENGAEISPRETDLSSATEVPLAGPQELCLPLQAKTPAPVPVPEGPAGHPPGCREGEQPTGPVSPATAPF